MASGSPLNFLAANPYHGLFVARIRESGSTANTLRGLVRYGRPPIPVACLASALARQAYAEHARHRAAVERYRADQAARTADPEASRARDDKRFRGAYLRRLRREEARLCRPPVTLDEAQSRANEWATRHARLAQIASSRKLATGRPGTPATMPATTFHVGPLDLDNYPHVASGRGVSRNSFSVLPCTAKTHVVSQPGQWRFKDSNSPANGPANGAAYWTKGTHIVYIQSWAMILNAGRRLAFRHDGQDRFCDAPEGYGWDRDVDGLRLVRADGHDYHVSAFGLLKGADAIRQWLDEQAEIQERKQRDENGRAERQATLGRVYDGRLVRHSRTIVTLEDSRRAGNCVVGSTAWAERNSLNPHSGAPVAVLVRLARALQEQRALRAAAEATRRVRSMMAMDLWRRRQISQA